MLLEKAQEVADVLMPAILNHGTGIPYGSARASPGWEPPKSNQRNSILAEVGTLQLEFVTLARETGQQRYADAVLHIIKQIDDAKVGMVPYYVNPQTGRFSGTLSMGAMADSYYEYLLKMDLMTAGKAPTFRRMYERVTNDAINKIYMVTNDRHR